MFYNYLWSEQIEQKPCRKTVFRTHPQESKQRSCLLLNAVKRNANRYTGSKKKKKKKDAMYIVWQTYSPLRFPKHPHNLSPKPEHPC